MPACASFVADVAPARVTIAQRSAQRGDMNPDARFLDDGVRPHPRKQLLFADHFAGLLDQSDQDVARAAAKTHGGVALEKEALRRKQAKRPEANDLFHRFAGRSL
jgi:hypothetical protein